MSFPGVLTLRFAAVAFALLLAASASAADRKPNFVFLNSDDHRWDAMGVVQKQHGDKARFPWFSSPNMDRLAAEGVRFRNAFVTLSLCAPSRAAFLTDRYNHANSITNNSRPFPTDSVTHATLLRGAGYKTAYVGKWHMGNQKGQRPGFDYSVSFIGQGAYNNCSFEINGVPTATKGWVDDVSTNYAIDWIRQQKDRPFSLVLGFKSPHGPRSGNNLPERHRKLYEDQTSRHTPNCGVPAIFHKPDSGKGTIDPDAQRNYFRYIQTVDDNIGKLLAVLDDLKLAADAVIVIKNLAGEAALTAKLQEELGRQIRATGYEVPKGAEPKAPMPQPAIIDAHVHLWDIDRRDGLGWIAADNATLNKSFLPSTHAARAKANNVEAVVVVQAGQSLPDNQWNLDITAGHKDLYRGVVGNLSKVIGTDEFAPLFEKLCQDKRYVGYRLSGRTTKTITDELIRDLKITAKAGRTVDILVGEYSLDDVHDISRRAPELKIILDHFGNVVLTDKPLAADWVKAFRRVAENRNVFCKVSALFGRVKVQPAPKDVAFYKPILDLAVESFGEDRIVFGSDWPVSELTDDYAATIQLVKAYFASRGPAVAAKVFQSNAAAFYGITPAKPYAP